MVLWILDMWKWPWRTLQGPVSAKVQRMFRFRGRSLPGLPVTQGGEYLCLSNFMQEFPQSYLPQVYSGTVR